MNRIVVLSVAGLFAVSAPTPGQDPTVDAAHRSAAKIVESAKKRVRAAEQKVEEAQQDLARAKREDHRTQFDTYSIHFMKKSKEVEAKIARAEAALKKQTTLFEVECKEINKVGLSTSNVNHFQEERDKVYKTEEAFQAALEERKQLKAEWDGERDLHASHKSTSSDWIDGRRSAVLFAEKELKVAKVFLEDAYRTQIETQRAALKSLPDVDETRKELRDLKTIVTGDLQSLKSHVTSLLKEVEKTRVTSEGLAEENALLLSAVKNSEKADKVQAETLRAMQRTLNRLLEEARSCPPAPTYYWVYDCSFDSCRGYYYVARKVWR